MVDLEAGIADLEVEAVDLEVGVVTDLERPDDHVAEQDIIGIDLTAVKGQGPDPEQKTEIGVPRVQMIRRVMIGVAIVRGRKLPRPALHQDLMLLGKSVIAAL